MVILVSNHKMAPLAYTKWCVVTSVKLTVNVTEIYLQSLTASSLWFTLHVSR